MIYSTQSFSNLPITLNIYNKSMTSQGNTINLGVSIHLLSPSLLDGSMLHSQKALNTLTLLWNCIYSIYIFIRTEYRHAKQNLKTHFVSNEHYTFDKTSYHVLMSFYAIHQTLRLSISDCRYGWATSSHKMVIRLQANGTQAMTSGKVKSFNVGLDMWIERSYTPILSL